MRLQPSFTSFKLRPCKSITLPHLTKMSYWLWKILKWPPCHLPIIHCPNTSHKEPTHQVMLQAHLPQTRHDIVYPMKYALALGCDWVCCGDAISSSTGCVYLYSSGLLHWYRDNCKQVVQYDMGTVGRYQTPTKRNKTWNVCVLLSIDCMRNTEGMNLWRLCCELCWRYHSLLSQRYVVNMARFYCVAILLYRAPIVYDFCRVSY